MITLEKGYNFKSCKYKTISETITVTFKTPKEWAPLLQWGTEDVISNIKKIY